MTDPYPERPADASPAMSQRVRNRQRGWRSSDILRAVALVMGMYWLARLVWVANPLFLTVFLGVLFGLAVASGVDQLARLRVPRGLGATVVVLAFFGILVGFGAWMGPTLQAQGAELRRRLPEAADQLETWVNSRRSGLLGMVLNGIAGHDSVVVAPAAARVPVAASPTAGAAGAGGAAGADTVAPLPPVPPVAPETATVASAIKHRLGARMSGATRFLFPFLRSTLEVVGGILVIIFLSIYIAVDPGLYHGGMMRLVPPKRRQRAGEVMSAIAAVLRRWLIIQLIAMAVIGVVTTIVLLLLHVKAAFALGLLAALFAFVPTIGPLVSAVPAVAMAFLDSPQKALLAAGALVLVRFAENHLLIPILMKEGVDVPPALTILAQALMAMLFGFLGLVCAVPLLAAAMVVIRMLYVENMAGEKKHALAPATNPAAP